MDERRYSSSRRAFVCAGASIAALPLGRWPQDAFGIYRPERSGAYDAIDSNIDPKRDYEILQAALNRRGTVLLDRTYVIESTLTIHGNTALVGSGAAKIVWRGPSHKSVLEDSSVKNPSLANRNILLQSFEVSGGNLINGHADQIAINFYRTGNVIIRDVTVHGVGGSGIRWGNSFADTTDVLIEHCVVFDCLHGDGIQGSGRRVKIRNNLIGASGPSIYGFGDTGIALIRDFSAATNPQDLCSSDVTIEHNNITGDYDQSGRFNGRRGNASTGIALGPFAIGSRSDIRIEGNIIKGCYVSLMASVMSNVAIVGNFFGSHGARKTANLRLDGVTDVVISDNDFVSKHAGASADYSVVMLVAQRGIYGASRFDSDVNSFVIIGNRFTAQAPIVGINLSFEDVAFDPAFTARISNGAIEKNRFSGVSKPIVFAPKHGNTPNVCNNINIRLNTVDEHAIALVHMAGNPNQYTSVTIAKNTVPPTTILKTGTGA